MKYNYKTGVEDTLINANGLFPALLGLTTEDKTLSRAFCDKI